MQASFFDFNIGNAFTMVVTIGTWAYYAGTQREQMRNYAATLEEIRREIDGDVKGIKGDLKEYSDLSSAHNTSVEVLKQRIQGIEINLEHVRVNVHRLTSNLMRSTKPASEGDID